MTNGPRDPSTNTEGVSRQFDLEERTSLFGEAIIRFAKRIPVNPITESLISQVVRCGTSIGSNYCEADDAGSKKEFLYRIRTGFKTNSVTTENSESSEVYAASIGRDLPILRF
jgi:hypothetical protein